MNDTLTYYSSSPFKTFFKSLAFFDFYVLSKFKEINASQDLKSYEKKVKSNVEHLP